MVILRTWVVVTLSAWLGVAAIVAAEGGELAPPVIPGGVPAETQKTLISYLPEDGFYGGLKRVPVYYEGFRGNAVRPAESLGVQFYDATNLYEYIDGQAEGFIAYNFQALASATYGANDDSNVTVDVYDMEKPIQAFGLYSTFRAPSNEFAQLGGQGFKTAEGYMFWKGRYAVRISGNFGDEKRLYEAALAAAKSAAGKIPDDRNGLDILALLPAQKRVANSEKYTMRAVLGQGFLDNGVTAEYNTGKGMARLFVCQFSSAEAASKAYAEYLKFATAHGKPSETESGKAFQADVKYYGMTEVFLAGRYLAGGVALPRENPKEGAALVESLKQSLASPARIESTRPR